ncbi:hypothetical protein [Sulfurimonas sp.]
MVEQTKKIYDDGKKSLDMLLRQKAYSEVEKKLNDRGVDIESVNDDDIEALVAAKIKDMMSGMKGFGVGTVFALAISLFTGV